MSLSLKSIRFANFDYICISLITIFSSIICQTLAFEGLPKEICISNFDINTELNCNSGEKIAIFEAFFTSSSRYQCSLKKELLTSDPIIDEQNQVNDKYPRLTTSCTEDIRLSLNQRCSGLEKCQFNVSNKNIHNCVGEDGNVIIKYNCIPKDIFYPFCNLNLTSSFGYISTPGYPKFYPPYDNCVWNIEGQRGQVIQIDILDAAIKEPSLSKHSQNIYRKKPQYQCSDSLVLKEEKAEVLTLCGEVKSNLIQFRTRTNSLAIVFTANEFSPTRGLLFKYSLQNCPTLSAPKNGHLIGRNGSYAYYSCCLDHVFEDTKEVDRVLFCQFANHWNSSLSKCIPKERSMSSSLTLSNDSDPGPQYSSPEDESDMYLSNILIPILLMTALLVANAVIVWVLFKLKRKQKSGSNNESNVPLNSGSALQTNV